MIAAMSWDPHVLHQPGPHDDCSECKINLNHHNRWTEAVAAGPVSDADAIAFSELTRQEWIAWKPQDEAPTVKHDKETKFQKFVSAHHGEDVTLELIMAETEAAAGTAYSYIREMSMEFRRVGTSRYRVTDPVRARAEALAGLGATLPQDRLNAPGAVTSAPGAVTTPREPSKP